MDHLVVPTVFLLACLCACRCLCEMSVARSDHVNVGLCGNVACTHTQTHTHRMPTVRRQSEVAPALLSFEPTPHNW